MHRLVMGALLAVAMMVLSASVAAGSHWTDPPGDSGAAPDIMSVDVSNDAAGNITFAVGLVSQHALTSDEGIGLYIDSDLQASTGVNYSFRPGIDYLVFLYTGNTWEFYAASNGKMVPAAHGSMSVNYTPTGFTVQINKAQLGGTSAFRFWIQTQKATASGSLAASDLAPDAPGAGYSYTLTTFAKVVASLKPASAAKGVHPGSRLAVSAAVGLSDGTTVAADSVSCTATVGGRPLPGAGTCAWKVPTTARGKKVVVTVTVGYGGASYSTRLSLQVLKK